MPKRSSVVYMQDCHAGNSAYLLHSWAPQKFWLLHATVTLSYGLGTWKCYQTVELNGSDKHAKL